jgi:hypothetical protein
MSDLIPVQWAALEVAESLMDVRMRKLSADADVRARSSELEGERLRAESELLASVGGEKGLGPNAEAQKRALAIHLRGCFAVTDAEAHLDGAREYAGTLGIRESYLEEVYKVFLASIPSGAALITQERLAQIIYPAGSDPASDPETQPIQQP